MGTVSFREGNSVGFSGTPQGHGTLKEMVNFPIQFSHILDGMRKWEWDYGIVWESYHKGGPSIGESLKIPLIHI